MLVSNGDAAMIKDEILQWIEKNADSKTAVFAASLVPGLKLKIYGVRLPVLREKAKQLEGDMEQIGESSCEELLLKAYVIGQIKDIPLLQQKIAEFVSKIDNWMICDSFCSALRLVKKHPDVFWPMIKNYARSVADYEQRFAYVMMLKYFCTETYIRLILPVLAAAKPKVWDTKQGVAWALAECFIKFPAITEPYLQKITPEIYKLTRRKILDSKRVSLDVKQKLKSENHVRLCE